MSIHHADPATLDEHAVEVEEQSALSLDHCVVSGVCVCVCVCVCVRVCVCVCVCVCVVTY